VFDQGLGSLFVVRVAGNIVAPSLIGSVEFAASNFGTQLVVVMGHTQCGAIAATLDVAFKGNHAPSENIQDIIQRILPQVEGLGREGQTREQLVQAATRANIRASVAQLKSGSRIIESLSREGKLSIIGAEYCLESGSVEFLGDIKPEI
jgi:carbonic anhydrase